MVYLCTKKLFLYPIFNTLKAYLSTPKLYTFNKVCFMIQLKSWYTLHVLWKSIDQNQIYKILHHFFTIKQNIYLNIIDPKILWNTGKTIIRTKQTIF